MNKAQELKQLTIENANTLDQVLTQAENSAKSGYDFTVLSGYVSQELLLKLIDKGFSVSKRDDPMLNKEIIIISW